MGICIPKEPDDTETLKSREKDAELQESARKDLCVRKLLFLGPGDSGKSTLFKQLVSIYGPGFSDRKKKRYTTHIYKNIFTASQDLLKFSVELGMREYHNEMIDCRISLDEKDQNDLKALRPVDGIVNSENVVLLKRLWSDEGIQNTLKLRSQIQMPYDVEYFFGDIDRIAHDDYVPTFTDILHCRARTTGIIEEQINCDSDIFKVVDVGGQKSERKKWIHCFENVTCVIFVVALSDFDLQLLEDHTINRMEEALQLFEEISQTQFLRNSALILFLNKSDLFRKKIKTTPLHDCPEYEDWSGSDPPIEDDEGFQNACNYIDEKFRQKNVFPERNIYSHVTTALDRNNVEQIFLNAKDVIIRESLKRAGLLDVLG